MSTSTQLGTLTAHSLAVLARTRRLGHPRREGGVDNERNERELPCARKSGMAAPSGRIPASREYRKALRQAEMAAWTASGSTPELSSLRELTAESALERRVETRLFLLVALLAAAAVGYGLLNSVELFRHWTDFVSFVDWIFA